MQNLTIHAAMLDTVLDHSRGDSEEEAPFVDSSPEQGELDGAPAITFTFYDVLGIAETKHLLVQAAGKLVGRDFGADLELRLATADLDGDPLLRTRMYIRNSTLTGA